MSSTGAVLTAERLVGKSGAASSSRQMGLAMVFGRLWIELVGESSYAALC